MSQEKSIKFRFEVDEASARKAREVIKGITSDVLKLVETLNRANFGGLLGGAAGSGGRGRPLVSGSVGPQPSAQQGVARVQATTGGILQTVQDHRQIFQNVARGTQDHMRMMSEALSRAVTVQKRELEALDKSAASLISRYDELGRKINAMQAQPRTGGRVRRISAYGAEREEILSEYVGLTARRNELGELIPTGGGPLVPGATPGGQPQPIPPSRGAGVLRMVGGGAAAVSTGVQMWHGIAAGQMMTAAARGDVISGLFGGARMGDFSRIGALENYDKIQGRARSAFWQDVVGSLAGPISKYALMGGGAGLAAGAVTGPGALITGKGGLILGGLAGLGVGIADIIGGSPWRAESHAFQAGMDETVRANPLTKAVYEDLQAHAGSRARHFMLGGYIPGRDSEAVLAGLSQQTKYFGLDVNQTMAMQAALAQQVGAQAAAGLTPTAAGAALRHGVSQEAAIPLLGQLTAGTRGDTARAKALFTEIFSKAFASGITDSRMREHIAEAVVQGISSSPIRTSGIGITDYMTRGGIDPNDLRAIEERREGLGVIDSLIPGVSNSVEGVMNLIHADETAMKFFGDMNYKRRSSAAAMLANLKGSQLHDLARGEIDPNLLTMIGGDTQENRQRWIQAAKERIGIGSHLLGMQIGQDFVSEGALSGADRETQLQASAQRMLYTGAGTLGGTAEGLFALSQQGMLSTARSTELEPERESRSLQAERGRAEAVAVTFTKMLDPEIWDRVSGGIEKSAAALNVLAESKGHETIKQTAEMMAELIKSTEDYHALIKRLHERQMEVLGGLQTPFSPSRGKPKL